MDKHGLSEADAFRFVQKTAMDTRATLKSVAQDVIDGNLEP
jgi:response regulator NasT